MPIRWVPCFLCSTDFNDTFRGEGNLKIGENYNKFAKFKTEKCPLCQGSGQLAIKPYIEKPLEKNRRNYS